MGLETLDNPLVAGWVAHLDSNLVRMTADSTFHRIRYVVKHMRHMVQVTLLTNENLTAMRLDLRHPHYVAESLRDTMGKRILEFNNSHFLGHMLLDVSDGEMMSSWATPIEGASAMSEDAMAHVLSVLLIGLHEIGEEALRLEYGLSQEIRDELDSLIDPPSED